MKKLITGIHHVTAVSGDAQENIDFYTGLLGMRLVKKTVNFDDPKAYHFYFGDATGTADTIMTTFPYGKDLQKGRHGKGKISTTAFSLPFSSVEYWEERLTAFHITFKPVQERFPGEAFIYLEDDDGLGIELVFTEKEERAGYSFSGHIPPEHSIRGIHHVELWLESPEKTGALLTKILNHELIHESYHRQRYAATDAPGHYIDILRAPDAMKGLPGRGMVHHVAFATPDGETQQQIMEKIHEYGLNTTGIKDRNYFTSIYFNEPGGIIFEIATEGPGFTADEDLSTLGMELKLPAQYEGRRAELSKILPTFNYPTEKFKK